MKFKGLIAATYTPFAENNTIDYDRILDLSEYYLEQELAGIFICGSTGEGPSMTYDERIKTTRSYLKAIDGKMPVIVHIGSNSIKEASELAMDAREHGASAISAAPPCYFKPQTIEAVINSMTEIAQSVPELPFYYYHIPALTSVNISIYELLKCVDNKIPNLAGVKFTHENLMDFQLSLEYSSDKYQLLFGRDEMLLAGLALGAVCGVGSTFNYAAPLYNKMIKAFNEKDMKTARECQHLSQKLILLLCKYGDACGKQIMRLLGYPVGSVRLPQSHFFADDRELYNDLSDNGLLEYLGGQVVLINKSA